MTTLTHRPLLVALAAVVLAAGSARAQDTAGPVVFRNTSGAPLTLSNVKYTDQFGTARTLEGKWELKAGYYGYLLTDNKKFSARKFSCDIGTAAGATNCAWTCSSLDKEGDFVTLFDDGTLAKHKEMLGKAPSPASPPYTALKPAMPAAPAVKGPTNDEIGRGVVKAVGALVMHQGTKKPARDLAEQFGIELLRTGRDELVKSAVEDLFPQLTAKERKTVSGMVILGFDGRLTPANLSQAESKAALVDYLRKQNPDLALAAEVADFLSRVQAGSRR